MIDGEIIILGWGGLDIIVVVIVFVLNVVKCVICMDVVGVFMIDLCYVKKV